MKNFVLNALIICFGFLISKGQGERVLFTDNFGAYLDKESLSGNSSGWDTTGVSDFINKKNVTYGATETHKTNFYAQLATIGAASAYREMELTAGNTYVFKAYLKTTNNKIYSTIRINVGGVDVVTSGNVSENNTWEELSVEYTPSVNETAKFVIQKTQAGILNVDKVKIICSTCSNKNVVFDFQDSKEGWVVGSNCTVALGFDGMVIKATNSTAIARSGDLSQNLNLNTADYNKAKITFKTPYPMTGLGFGKLYLYDSVGGNTQFVTYDFDRDGSNTTTFQTAEVDLTSNADYIGSIARIGLRAPWEIKNGQKVTIQRIELYYECKPIVRADTISACASYTWINGVTYMESNDTSKHVLKSSNGCDSTVSLNLTIHAQSDSVTVIDENTLQAEAKDAVTYMWINCSNSDSILGDISAILSTQIPGDYAVILTDENGCVDTSSCYTISNLVEINETPKVSYQIKTYPNPAANFLTLNFNGSSSVAVELLDLQGKLILSNKQVFNQDQLNLVGIPTGTYFLRILSNQGNQQVKVRIK
jgi:hypothetical protein